MAARNDSGGNDRDGADAVVLELLVLDRLVYRNRSQHRSAKYFTLVLEVRRACTTFAAPKLPDLLAKGLGRIASVPDSRNGRAREAWVRSASTELSRMRVAAIACAYSLESIVKASKHLAHQVSQTYFMALSTVFLACLARLFACNLHLGGRLLQVHGALLRTLLAQPCTSECLSASDVVECRVPEGTVSFLSRLRGAGGAHKAARVRNTEDSSSAVATSGPRGSDPAAVSSPLQPATPKSSSHPKRGEIRTSAALDEDEDDTGEHIGRAPMATEEEAGEEVEMEEQAVAAAAEKKTQQKQSTKKLGRAAAESTKGGGGRGRASAAVETSVDARADGAQRASGESGASSNEGARKTRVGAARKKVVLASEFSDSSSEAESDTENAAVTVGSSSSSTSTSTSTSRRKDQEGPTQPQLPVNKATTVSDTASEQPMRHQPSLFFSSTPRRPQQPRSKPNDRATSGPVVAAATVTSPASNFRVGVADAGDGIAVPAALATAAGGQTPKLTGVVAAPVPEQAERVGWIIDPTPTPRPAPAPSPTVDASLSGRKRKGKKSGRGRGGGDRQAGAAAAAAAAAGVTVKEASAPAQDGLREGATAPVSATPDAATPAGESSGVAVDGGEEADDRPPPGGGGSGGSRTATDIRGSAPPRAETSNRKGRGRLDNSKARRCLPSDSPTLGSGSPGARAQPAQEPKAGKEEPLEGNSSSSVSGMARGQTNLSGKKVKGGAGGGAGAKRNSSGQGLEEKSRKAKKQKKKKKKETGEPRLSSPGGSGKRSGSGGGRNAIDDIFVSLL